MEFGYILIGGIGVFAFVIVMINKRSTGYRAILNKLENENNLIEVRIGSLEEEREQVQSNVAQLRGKVEAHEEAKAAEMRAVSDAALEKDKVKHESFIDFLVRTAVVTPEHLAKVKTYKEKNGSPQTVEELLIMLDYVGYAELKRARVEYDSARMDQE